MEKLEIIKSYSRYLNSLKEENSNIIGNFDKMYKYLNSKVSIIDKDLWQSLTFDCVYKTLTKAKERQVKYKSFDQDWNNYSIERCYQLIDNFQKAERTQDNEMFDINLYRLFKLLTNEELPNVVLFMWHTFSKTELGGELLKSEREKTNKLLKAQTEEEIDELLTSKEQLS